MPASGTDTSTSTASDTRRDARAGAPARPRAQQHRQRRNPAGDTALIAVFAAFIAVCSILSFPVGAAPVTLQTFAVLLTGAVLGASRGALAALLYLAVGAAGLPVFAGGTAGLAPFVGPTVGYLAAFPFIAGLTGFLVRRIPARSIALRTALVFAAMLVATVLFSYVFGIAGLIWRASMSPAAAFALNLTFIPLDLAKMVLAAIVATAVHRAFPALLPGIARTSQRAGRPAATGQARPGAADVAAGATVSANNAVATATVAIPDSTVAAPARRSVRIDFRDATVVVPIPPGDSTATAGDSTATATILHPTTLDLVEQRISIVGANGSGKSTLSRLINGLIEPTSGSVGVTVDGTRIDTAADGAAVRREVGFVFANPDAQLIMPTPVEDVELSLRRSYRGKAERRAAALAALDRFGIAHLAERSAHTLSGGQKQMLAIASVLATDPAVLIADEPTTMLDLRNALRVGDLLMSIPQQTIIVTHDLDLAARADRTLVVESGRVVFDGDPDEAIAFYRETAGRR